MTRLLTVLLVFVGALVQPAEASDVTLDPLRQAELARLDPIRGPAVSADALQGRIVIVTFFASWCPPCHQEFRDLKRLGAEYRDRGLSIVAVNLFETWGNLADPARLEGFLARHDPPFAVVRGEAGTGALFGDVSRIPTLFLFGPDGEAHLHFVHERGSKQTYVGYDRLKIVIDSLLRIEENKNSQIN